MKSLSTRAAESGSWLSRLLALLRGESSPARVGLSVGLGLFIGCQPLYGFHLPLCLLVCLPFGLDAVIAYVAANISNPLLAPFLLLCEIEIGSRLLHGHAVAFDLARAERPSFAGIAGEVALGSVVFGGVLGALGGLLGAFIARSRSRVAESPLDLARKRTLLRYAKAPPGDRYYVAAKLRTDPSLAQIAELGPLGDVLDAGCGRGQLGLCLAELGHVGKLSGFDFDARKIELARRAAGERADYAVSDLREAAFAAVDSLLLIDVLHYLDGADQDRLLVRAAKSLRPGGRLIVREVDAASTRKSLLVRVFERMATRLGYNRAAGSLGFRPLAEIQRTLENAGLRCERPTSEARSLLENRLLVAHAFNP